MFLPTTKQEFNDLGWEKAEVLIVSGDTYIDHSFNGAAVIGKVLLDAGYKVGIIAQPDFKSGRDITRLGEPTLFWGITSGCVDSMVSNYTPLKKPRRHDDFTPGEKNNRRPDRAVIVYSNLIRQYFKNTKPIVLGGIEASLRRIPHYDYWDDKIRRSILFDAKADILVYGMGEKAVLEIANLLKELGSHYEDSDLQTKLSGIRGICYISKSPRTGYQILPSYEEVEKDRTKFIEMFHTFYQNNDPVSGKGLCQKHGNRFLIQNPPAHSPTTEEIDKYYELDYERDIHPFYKKDGKVRALDTIKFSITTHRGCYGECNFCAISIHQGKEIVSRSQESIIREAQHLVKMKDFKGYIQDVGGPTANMYNTGCNKMIKNGKCIKKDCIFPSTCSNLEYDHQGQINLLRKLRGIKGIKKIFVSSGIRHDLILKDNKSGKKYLEELLKYHISGQMKIAPEHTEDRVLSLMRKPGAEYLKEFKQQFYEIDRHISSRGLKIKRGSRRENYPIVRKDDKIKPQFLTYYFIVAHPGSTLMDEIKLKKFISKELKVIPEQVQIFTPTPSTYSTLMYYTEMNPWTGEKLYVEKNLKNKEKHKKIILGENR